MSDSPLPPSPAPPKTPPAREAKRREPASHWDLIKSTMTIIGTLAGIVLGFIAFGDRVVARAEGKTNDGVKGVKDSLSEHISAESKYHATLNEVLQEVRTELKEQRSDIKAVYRAMPYRRMQMRLEPDVEDPPEDRVRGLGLGPVLRHMPDAGR